MTDYDLVPFNSNLNSKEIHAHFFKPERSIKDNVNDLRRFALALLQKSKESEKADNMIRIKYYLEKRHIECYQIIKKAVRILDGKTYQNALKELYERGMILEVGTEDPDAMKKKRIYDITNSLKNTSTYYKNNPETNFENYLYQAHIDDQLKKTIKLHIKEYESKIEQAKDEEKVIQRREEEKKLSKKPKWIKAGIVLQEKLRDKIVSQNDIKEILTIETNTLPSSEKRFDQYFRFLLNKKVLIKTISEEDDIRYKLNPQWNWRDG